MHEDTLQQWIAFEALNVASGDFEICPECNTGILISVHPDQSNRMTCDICDVEFIITNNE